MSNKELPKHWMFLGMLGKSKSEVAVIREYAEDYARAALAAQPVAQAPADPMDWPLPCDVTVGHGTMRKGVALRTLVLRMKALYEMATGENADEVAGRSLEDRRARAKPLLDASALRNVLIGGCPSCGRQDCVARACCTSGDIPGWPPKQLAEAMGTPVPEASKPVQAEAPSKWPQPDPRFMKLAKAAINLLAACDSNHDTKSGPQKYGVPYGEVNALRDALDGSHIAAHSPASGVVEREALLELLRHARPYVEHGAKRFYDGTGGYIQRDRAKHLLEKIDRAAIATQPLEQKPAERPRAFTVSDQDLNDLLNEAHYLYQPGANMDTGVAYANALTRVLKRLAQPEQVAQDRFERAMKETWQMIDPLRPPPAGTYALGEYNGIAAALKTLRENYERAVRASGGGI